MQKIFSLKNEELKNNTRIYWWKYNEDEAENKNKYEKQGEERNGKLWHNRMNDKVLNESMRENHETH